MVLDILCNIVEASYTSLPFYGGKGGGRSKGIRGTAYPGWSENVKPYQDESRYWDCFEFDGILFFQVLA